MVSNAMVSNVSCGFCGLRERTAEHHVLADPRNPLPVADHLEIPERVRGIADQHRAGELAVYDHQLLVGAAPDVAEQDAFAAVAAQKIARRKDAHAGNLEI